ncbi:hypothetical protein CIL05_07775 [Virgibacillus profundi]|uniref:Dihydrofolate reductase n=1 Tax=Virgibacillus profundi TaxID=2024555 RepID=A0A2A2IEB7_9BACI|nr:dihydrofolate reductase [Virgibacillus profundi]PAV30361.1 hypothetical protein CIL05_07775 [Virgibacillus profundi]PXY54533.1 dihydrofolate reductase [Virgibacillus profundi]
MILSLIAAVDDSLGLGFENDLLWKNKEDLAFFKQHTNNKVCIMGRKTYESIGSPLKGRINIVLTSDKTYNPHPNALVRHNLSEVLHEFRNVPELVCIGGEQLYTTLLPLADRLYLTKVHHTFSQVDTHFPTIDEDEWSEYFYKQGTEKSKYKYTFHVYSRKAN